MFVVGASCRQARSAPWLDAASHCITSHYITLIVHYITGALGAIFSWLGLPTLDDRTSGACARAEAASAAAKNASSSSSSPKRRRDGRSGGGGGAASRGDGGGGATGASRRGSDDAPDRAARPHKHRDSSGLDHTNTATAPSRAALLGAPAPAGAPALPSPRGLAAAPREKRRRAQEELRRVISIVEHGIVKSSGEFASHIPPWIEPHPDRVPPTAQRRTPTALTP